MFSEVVQLLKSRMIHWGLYVQGVETDVFCLGQYMDLSSVRPLAMWLRFVLHQCSLLNT